MLKKPHWLHQVTSLGKKLPLMVLMSGLLINISGCNGFFTGNKQQTLKAEDGTTIDLNDETVKQYVTEWHNSKPSIDRLAKLETDLSLLLGEVSKMSDIGQVPGLEKAPVPSQVMSSTTPTQTNANSSMQKNTHALAPEVAQKNTNSFSSTVARNNANNANNESIMQQQQPSTSIKMQPTEQVLLPPIQTISSGYVTNGTASATAYPNTDFCPEAFINHYKKSVVFANFPRTKPTSSSLGGLYQVDQHLPMLLGANLRNRHSMLTPLQLTQYILNENINGELNTAAQIQTLARQHRAQFFITGEVDDMSMGYPKSIDNTSYYTRFINGAHNLLHINTPLDKRSRIFSFTVKVRDGFNGQTVFSNQYTTFGKWKPALGEQVGFASPRFWSSDYGKQIQQLVAKASDEIANVIRCQPYVARVDSRPGQQQIIIQSGLNNGLRIGDALDLYQLVYQPITGEYQQFDTRLIKRNSKVYITEAYPAHSVAQVSDEMILSGQYLVMAQ